MVLSEEHSRAASASEYQLALWTCASFAPPLILVLGLGLSLDGFSTADKYVLVFGVLVVAPVFGVWAAPQLNRRLPGCRDYCFCLNAVFTCLGAIWLLSGTPRGPLWPFNAGVLALLYIASLCVLALALGGGFIPRRGVQRSTLILLSFTPAVFFFATVAVSQWYLIRGFHAIAGLFGGLLFAALFALWRHRHWVWLRHSRLLGALGLLIIVVAPLAMMDGEFDYDALHYTAYLASSTAVAAGRIPLIDVFCQYGQAYLVYNIGFTFLPWGYGSAALVTSVLNVLYTILFLIILRRMVRHQAAFCALAATLPFLFWLLYHYSPNVTPSQGGMRYLPLVALGTVLVWMPSTKHFSVLSAAALVLCLAWSFESALYGIFIYGVFGVATVSCNSPDWRDRLAGTSWLMVRILALVFAFGGLVTLAYLVLFHDFPRYDLYVSMFMAYVGPDPFTEYAYLDRTFYGWVAFLASLMPLSYLLARRALCADEIDAGSDLPRYATIWALACVMSVYCLISTQGYTLKIALMPWLILLYAIVEGAVLSRPLQARFSVSELGVGPTFVLMGFFLTGVAIPNFAGPPVYSSPNTSILRHLISDGRLFRSDVAEHLSKVCNVDGVIEPGNVCTGETNIPPVHYTEFKKLIEKWQANDSALLILHPVDALMNVTMKKAHVLPLSYSYTDGFSPALFQHLVAKSGPTIDHMGEKQTLIASKNLGELNELEWAMLSRITSVWRLARIDQTEHFEVYRLLNKSVMPAGPLINLPSRPIGIRNKL